MFKNLRDIQNCEASMYLSPENFITGFDVPGDDYSREQYEKGLRVGRASREVFVRYSGAWGAVDTIGYTTSYEVIGYHRSTADLLRGFLDSGCRFVVMRDVRNPETGQVDLVTTVLVEGAAQPVTA